MEVGCVVWFGVGEEVYIILKKMTRIEISIADTALRVLPRNAA